MAPLEFGHDRMEAHLIDLESVLSRIDSGRTYYQILGVDRTDSPDEVKASYQQLLDVIFPSPEIADSLSSELASRIDRAYAKASQAFGVLASFTKRKEYDGALLSTTPKPATHAPRRPQAAIATETANSTRPGSANQQGPGAAPENDARRVGSMPGSGQAYSESSRASSSDNRRRCGRMKLSIPVRVTGHDHAKGKWHEMTNTINVSRTGARLLLHRRVKPGTVLFLTLPMPTKLRAHGLADQSYNVYALIRTVDPPANGERAVGLEFLGEHPPTGFIEKPWAVYRAKRRGGNERRRHGRVERSETFAIEYLDEKGQPIGKEQARSENIGRRGLRVVGTAAPAEFDLIAIYCARIHFNSLATLRDRYRGKDGLERLCLELIDKEWPA